MTPKIQASFKKYNQENPIVYELFKQKANALYKKGFRHYSAWAILTNIRVQHNLTGRQAQFKVNNDHIALFSRKLMADDPKFKGFFTTKPLK